MLLKSQKVAFLGILLAIAVLLTYAGVIIESSTLFFLCGASFCLGIAIMEFGKRLGTGFFIACTLLTFILVPTKMYCLTLAAMNLYILLAECLTDRIHKAFCFVKYLIFNVIYLPVLWLMPEFIYKGKLNKIVLLGLWVGGQVGFTIYDIVYSKVMYLFWPEFRKKIIGNH